MVYRRYFSVDISYKKATITTVFVDAIVGFFLLKEHLDFELGFLKQTSLSIWKTVVIQFP